MGWPAELTAVRAWVTPAIGVAYPVGLLLLVTVGLVALPLAMAFAIVIGIVGIALILPALGINLLVAVMARLGRLDARWLPWALGAIALGAGAFIVGGLIFGY